MFSDADDEENPFLEDWNVDEIGDSSGNINLGYFQNIVADKKYHKHYFYDGSFTTPTCDEIVNWIVYGQVLPMSTEQKDRLKAYYEDDASFADGNGNNREV